MRGILRGLALLHSHNVVLRELNPGCILIASETAQPVITDLEMAKLLDGAPTVRNGSWPMSPFRAPEVDSGQATPAADLFSWAAVLLNVATGREPRVTSIKEAIAEAELPDAVTDVVKKCLSSAPSRRLQDCESVRKAISKWI
jgi:serine/threonine protein kinase